MEKEKQLAKILNNGKAEDEDKEVGSWKSKRGDDRMHKISFHADKICHTGKYGKQPNTKYQMFSEQIISNFSSRKQVTLSSKYDSAHLKIVQNALIHQKSTRKYDKQANSQNS